jgi:hypothetical protein
MLIEGTVQQQGQSFRVTVRLLDSRNGFSEWSQTYDQPLARGFAAQDSIATDVTAAVAWRMGLPAPYRARRDTGGTATGGPGVQSESTVSRPDARAP